MAKKKRRPYNKSTGRNYARDYKKFQSSEKSKKDRAKRNAARRKLMRSGRVKKGDGRDVHHIRGVSQGNNNKNLRVTTKKYNRGRK